MKTLDLCVVADQKCPTSRAYLTYLATHGYRPAAVIVVDFSPKNQQPRPRASWLSHLSSWAWPGKKTVNAPEYSSAFQTLCRDLQAPFAVQVDFFGPFSFEHKAKEVVQLSAENYEDDRLQHLLCRRKESAFLYTNGGRVPESLLRRLPAPMIHIHPGWVPDVRGSDCFFWSILTENELGMSCFYMNAGIDTGDIITRCHYPFPSFDKNYDQFIQNQDEFYRAILHAYDPHLRAQTLLSALTTHSQSDLGKLPSTPQFPDDGRTFFWMHPKLIGYAIRKVCKAPSSP